MEWTAAAPPGNRLQKSRRKEGRTAMDEVVIEVRTNGPYKVTGPVKLVDMDGNAIPREGEGAIFLCRCGQSGEKPFCDGSHKRCGWKSE